LLAQGIIKAAASSSSSEAAGSEAKGSEAAGSSSEAAGSRPGEGALLEQCRSEAQVYDF
jgi:hypothetical protein